MKNMKALRKELSNVIKDLKNETLSVRAAKEVINAAGKIINSCKTQLEYSSLRKENPDIDFLKE